MFEDECTIQSHTCARRVSDVLEHVRGRIIGPPIGMTQEALWIYLNKFGMLTSVTVGLGKLMRRNGLSKTRIFFV